MSKNTEFQNITFDLPKNRSNVIKVIGVGGGGSNAINHMFQAGINGVDFVVCNTDAQALHNSPVPNKIQLGVSLTEGLGAGANPEVGEQAALESMEEIKTMLEHTTKMVFITAGMGGGTGTGAAPVIAKLAKELDILTVGIVTIPFQFEGMVRNKQAQTGIEKLRANVDSLIVINNNKLREVYGNLGFKAGFSKADEVLATAAKGIAEVITHHYTQNIDLRDAKTVLSNSGTAIMGSATAEGANRAAEAISKALDSPLLNDNKIKGAQNVLLLIVSGAQEITIDEIGEINDHIQIEAGHGANIIMGIGEDQELGEAIAVTVIATGFHADQQHNIVNTEAKKIFYTLEDEQTAAHDLTPEATAIQEIKFQKAPVPPQTSVSEHPLEVAEQDQSTPDESLQAKNTSTLDDLTHLPVVYEVIAEKNTQNKANIPPSETRIQDKPSNLNPEKPDANPTPKALNPEPGFQQQASPCRAIDKRENIYLIEVIDPEVITPKSNSDQFTLHFDLPLPKTEEKKQIETSFKPEKDIKNIEVNEYTEVKPVQESNSADKVCYNLEEYMELETHLTTAKPTAEPPLPQAAEETLEYQKKTLPPDTATTENNTPPSGDPFNNSINELLRARTEERRRNLKTFNYTFKNTSIDTIEKQPAYKRQGVDLNEVPKEQKLSRTTLSEDSNEELKLRSNNSFLHDNVD